MKRRRNRWDSITFPERLFAKIEKSAEVFAGEPCWLWVGPVNRGGYGCHIYRGGKSRMAHQAAYEEWVGPIPDGLVIDHLCRNRRCCNPRHLEAVTHRENVVRGTGWCGRNARKTHCRHGHEFTPENTYIRANGQRNCRACHAARERRRREPGYIRSEARV